MRCFATNSFSSGVHRWDVHIDKCVSKNIFVGVMTDSSALDNYVGSDNQGWGYLANKAIWHDKGKLRPYGELYREGDVIGVTLDLDEGMISFTRNGQDLGVAVTGLRGEFYPAFSLYNKGDRITLCPTRGGVGGGGAGGSAMAGSPGALAPWLYPGGGSAVSPRLFSK